MPSRARESAGAAGSEAVSCLRVKVADGMTMKGEPGRSTGAPETFAIWQMSHWMSLLMRGQEMP